MLISKLMKDESPKIKNSSCADDPLIWLLGNIQKNHLGPGIDLSQESNLSSSIGHLKKEDPFRYGNNESDEIPCESVITADKVTHAFAHFIACFIYSYWHDIPFKKVVSHKKKALLNFASFVRDILKVTCLQLSVILLSLRLVIHLKYLKPNINGAEGSEFRLLVCTLILSMKILMDNTYTNFTWQKVSKIPLDQINIVEMEFLAQVDYKLYFSREEFKSWISYLKSALMEFVIYEASLSNGGCKGCRKHPLFSKKNIIFVLNANNTSRNDILNSSYYEPFVENEYYKCNPKTQTDIKTNVKNELLKTYNLNDAKKFTKADLGNTFPTPESPETMVERRNLSKTSSPKSSFLESLFEYKEN